MRAFHGARLPCAFRKFRTGSLVAVWGLGSLPAVALAVDVTLDVRDIRQYSNTAVRTFETSNRRETLTVRQLGRLLSGVTLEARLRLLRETAGNDATGVRLETEQETVQPDLIATYHRRNVDVGLKANWLRRDVSGASGLAPESRRNQFGGWLQAEPDEDTRLSASMVRTGTDEEGAPGGDTSRRQWTTYLRADRNLGELWKADYGLTGLSSDLVTQGTRRDEWTHSLELIGNPRILSDRLDTYVRTRNQFSRQTVEVDPVEGPTVLGRPLSAVVILDDTPDVHDPLEDDGVAVPGLFDRDLETPTSVNLGDAASVVREFGGDYRNIVYDFGETEQLASAVLYVDTRLLNPELYVWRVFVTDDPDGREWEELGADRATVTYREWGAVLQGWEVAFQSGVAGRFFKLVDVKLGPTVPDLYVTELEVDVRDVSAGTDRREDGWWHEIETSLDYALTAAWDVGYTGEFDARRFTGASRDTDRWNHGVRTDYTLDRYRISAAWDTHVVTTGGRRNTDVQTYRIWGTRIRDKVLSGTASWYRTVDGSGSRDRITDTYSVSSSWRAAPRLRVHNVFSHGRRHDDVLDVRSRSWVVTNRIESSPLRTVSVDLDYTERWVSQAAGSGFQRFRDVYVDAAWTPVPLVSFSNTTRYQLRSSGEWDTRESVTWSPFRGATLEPVFSGDAFRDTRVDTWELGARATARWRMRSGLLAEGTVETRRFDVAGVETSPVSTDLHVSWSF